MNRRVIFYIFLILIPFLLLLLFEGCLRVFGYGKNLDLFVPSVENPGYYKINADVADRYFSKSKGTSPSNDIFLIEKPGSCYRIFVMGCSTTRGFPYEMNVTFSRILNYRLQDAFPDVHIEVINTAMAAINSYTQADFIDEILEQKPDAILIYTGHNEYYGALGVGSVENGGNARWLKKIHISLVHLRIYQLIQNTIGKISSTFSPSKNMTATLMQRMVRDKDIVFGSDEYFAGIEQFKKNMDDVVAKAKKANIPVLFSEVVSNISGLSPLKSFDSEQFPRADKVFEQAVELEKKGEFNKARELYYKAKDLDAIRFRAPEDLNKAIDELSLKYKAPVVKMKEFFEKNSPNGLIGNNLMTEHLHPNVDGYFLIADAFFNEMMKNKFIANTWDSTKIKPSTYYRNNWGFTALDSLVADIRIKSLLSGWPFKSDTVVNNYIYTYKPNGYEDSVALMVVKYDNVSIQQMHINLAKYYAGKGDYQKSFSEYYSLVKTNPYTMNYVIEALNYATLLNDDNKAISLLESMPNIDSSYFVCVKLGKLYLKNNQTEQALSLLNKALKVIKAGDNREYALDALYNTYVNLGNEKMSGKTLGELKAINPNYKASGTDKADVIVVVDKEIKNLISSALQLAKAGELDNALNLLYKSIEIKESAFAYQMIGSILYKKNDNRAIEYLERANELDPKDLQTINNLFVLYLLKKDYKNANICIEKYSSLGEKIRAKELRVMLNDALKASK